MVSKLRTIDLFAGAGGLTLGLELAGNRTAGFKPVYAVEHDAAAAHTYKRNFNTTVFDGDIEFFDPRGYPEADVIIGGPPCQGFSTLGRDRDDSSRAALNSLWGHYLSAVLAVKPLAFVIENVPQFQKSAQFKELLHRMEHDPLLSTFGYAYGVLNAADYGVPQNRKRGIFMAVRDADVSWPPARTHGADDLFLPAHRTVADAISDVPAQPTTDRPTIGDDGAQDLHIKRNPTAKSVVRYRTIPPGGNRFDLQEARPDITPACWLNKPTGTTDGMGRMWWDRPAPTIRTEFFKPEKGRYLHPEEHRPVTHREAARLQSFPDDFVFEGSKLEIARQIGNAVPPLLGKAIGEHVLELLGARSDAP